MKWNTLQHLFFFIDSVDLIWYCAQFLLQLLSLAVTATYLKKLSFYNNKLYMNDSVSC